MSVSVNLLEDHAWLQVLIIKDFSESVDWLPRIESNDFYLKHSLNSLLYSINLSPGPGFHVSSDIGDW